MSSEKEGLDSDYLVRITKNRASSLSRVYTPGWVSYKKVCIEYKDAFILDKELSEFPESILNSLAGACLQRLSKSEALRVIDNYKMFVSLSEESTENNT